MPDAVRHSDVLIVGGLTIDHFADGRTAPGGSVLHAGLAAAAEGVRPTLLTVAGDEPEARAGLEGLASLGELVHQRAASTIAFGHEESDGRRVLVYRSAAEPIEPGRHPDLPRSGVALLAPIADEVPPAAIDAVRARFEPSLVVMLIQGWLRRLAPGDPVQPLALDTVDPRIWEAFGAADAIVVSTEDLAEGPEDPFRQAASLRARIGSGPILVLTLGARGYLLDDPHADRIIASRPRTVVDGVPSVGAGDTFGAVLAIHLARGDEPVDAANAASNRVIATLEGRRA